MFDRIMEDLDDYEIGLEDKKIKDAEDREKRLTKGLKEILSWLYIDEKPESSSIGLEEHIFSCISNHGDFQ